MTIKVIYDTKQNMSLTLDQFSNGKLFVVRLFDHVRGEQRQYFSREDFETADNIFNQLEKAYCLK